MAQRVKGLLRLRDIVQRVHEQTNLERWRLFRGGREQGKGLLDVTEGDVQPARKRLQLLWGSAGIERGACGPKRLGVPARVDDQLDDAFRGQTFDRTVHPVQEITCDRRGLQG